jgi:hypothetical protein
MEQFYPRIKLSALHERLFSHKKQPKEKNNPSVERLIKVKQHLKSTQLPENIIKGNNQHQ